jgi:hypothetical protein
LVLHCWHWTVRLQWMHLSGLQTIMNSSWNLCLDCNIPSSGNAISLQEQWTTSSNLPLLREHSIKT